jgi:hypothetical protein
MLIALSITMLIIGCYLGFYFFKKTITVKLKQLKEYDDLINSKKNIVQQLNKEITKNEEFIYYQNDIGNELCQEIESYRVSCDFYKQEALALRANSEKHLEEYSEEVAAHKAELEQSISTLITNYVEKAKQLQAIVKSYEDKVKAYIEEQKKLGNYDLVLKPISTDEERSPHYDILDVEADPEHPRNKDMAKYYGLNTVVAGENSDY